MKKFIQFASYQNRNDIVEIFKFQSNRPITLEVIVSYFEENYSFDEERENIALVDKPINVSL